MKSITDGYSVFYTCNTCDQKEIKRIIQYNDDKNKKRRKGDIPDIFPCEKQNLKNIIITMVKNFFKN
jgi:hypothetical protein